MSPARDGSLPQAGFSKRARCSRWTCPTRSPARARQAACRSIAPSTNAWMRTIATRRASPSAIKWWLKAASLRATGRTRLCFARCRSAIRRRTHTASHARVTAIATAWPVGAIDAIRPSGRVGNKGSSVCDHCAIARAICWSIAPLSSCARGESAMFKG